MLRLRALSLICLGLLVSCGPAEPVGSTSGAPGEQKASAVATLAGSVSLADSGLAPVISVPSSLSFGERQVNTSAQLGLTVTNTGTSVLSIPSITKGGTGAAAYSFFPTSIAIPAGATATLTVAFSPTAQGPANAILTLTTNDPANATVVVALSGTGVNPSIVVPSSLAFGEQVVGTSSQQVMTVSNAGTGTLLVTNAVLSGSGAAAYTVTPTTFSVQAGQSVSLMVTFAPTAQAVANASLTLSTNDITLPTVAVALTGTGVKPTISVPSLVSFGDVQVNTNKALALTVSNTGTGTLNIPSIAKSGPNAAFFTFTPSTLSVPPGGSATVTVVFSPTVVGAATATLTLVTNDLAKPSVTVSLTGTGVSPTIAVQPSLAFGEQAVNTSAQGTLTVSNTGTGTLVISSAVLGGAGAGAYSVTPNVLSIQQGQSASMVVTFTPPALGAANASLTLTTNDVTHPTVVVALSGTGVSPTIVVNPVALDFGSVAVGSNATKTLTVSNTGTGTLSISNITKSGSGAAAFSFSPATLDLPAGQTRTLTVVFSPTVEGQAAATLTLSSNDVAKPTVTITLSGAGGGATAVVSPSVLDFGGVKVGTSRQLTVTLANTGTSPLVVSNVTSATSIFSYVGPQTFTVSPNSSFSFQVAFSPANAVSYAGAITLTSNASNGPTTVSLTGVGTSAQLSVSPTSIFFGDVRVGTESTRMAVTVVSSGTGEVVLQSLPVVGPFAVALHAGDALPRTIPAAGSFSFDVIFRPTQPGTATGSVSIVSDAGNPLAVSLSGNGTVAQLQWSVTSLDFGAQRLLQPSGTQPVIISNTGSAELEISQLVFSQPAFTLAMMQPPTPEAPLRIAPGQQKAVFIIFTPNALGATTGKLFAISNAFVPAPPLELAGTGVDGQLSMLPTQVAFGQVAVGGSAQQNVVLKNTGSYPLTILQVTPPAGAPFTISGLPVGLVLQPAESWPFTVTFAPTQQGAFTATALIKSDCITNPQFSLALAGTGGSASLSLQVSASQVAFGNVLVGSSSSYTLTLTNVGTTELFLSNMAFAGADSLAFTLTPPLLPLVLQPAASVSLVVAFHPDAVRAFSGELRVYSNDPVSSTLVVSLSGTGVQHQLHLSEASLDFGRQLVGSTSSPRTVRIINTGSIPATLSALTVEGSGASQFAVVTPTLPLVVAAGQEQVLSVTFTPQAEGEVSGTLKALFVEPAPQLEAVLHGQGVRPVLSISPSVLDFGSLEVGEQSPFQEISVTNPSSQALTVTVKLRDDGSPFALDAGGLANPLPPGGSAIFKVSFQPTAVGAAQNEVQVLAQGATEPAAHFTVKGAGVEPEAGLEPEPDPGTGCSNSVTGTGGSGLLALLALAALGSRRRRSARG